MQGVIEDSESLAQRVADRLFFVVGCGRSGTSLLTVMLSAHPAMIALNEVPFWHAVYRKHHRRFQRLKGERFVDAVLDQLYRCWWAQELAGDRAALRAVCLAKALPDWKDIYAGLLSLQIKDEDPQRVGEKSPSNLNYVEVLSRSFPNSQFVHIVRDPRAVLRSVLQVDRSLRQVAPIMKRWRSAVDQHLTYARHLGPGRYLLLRYEDLVRDPQCELQRVCRFMGQDYHAAMLEYHQRSEPGFSRYKSHHMANTLNPVVATHSDRWREELSSAQVGLVEYRCHDHMKLLGYDRTNTSVSFPQLRLAASQFLGQATLPGRWLGRRRRASRITAELRSHLKSNASAPD